ncbi:MAG: T9SS type A sorting domain-containing protein [Candidatus Cloacimonetes bacterium]|nr:T9SS type A sorting domain-containing protein [Candidatus Cloacimonadota bacterium]
MKYASLFLMLCMLSSLVAQEFDWDDNGIPVVQGANLEWGGRGALMPDGGVVFVWTDTRTSARQVVAKKLMPDGSAPWGEEPVYVCLSAGLQQNPVIIGSSDGGCVIAWIDYIDDNHTESYAQKLDAQGNQLWGEGGVALCTTPYSQHDLNIVPDLNGGAFIIWDDDRNAGGSDIYGVRIDASGDNLWSDNGIAVASGAGEQSGHTFWQDGQGGAILAYVSDYLSDSDIYIKRILPDGVTDWITVICDADVCEGAVKMYPTGENTFGFAWRDRRDDNQGDIYAQACDIDGNLLWASEVVVYAGACRQENPRVTSSGDGCMFIAWQDARNDGYYCDCYVQKLDSDGNLLWDADGVALVDEDYYQWKIRLVPGDSGDVYVIWEDERNQHPSDDIYIQRVSAEGTILWEEDGRAVCTLPGRQHLPSITRSGEHLMLAWADMWPSGESRCGPYYDANAMCLRSQVFTLDGAELLVPDGQVFAEGPITTGMNIKPQLVPCGEATYLLWDMEMRNADQLRVQKILPDGSLAWGELGKILVGSDESSIYEFTAIPHHSGGVTFAWVELVSGTNRVFANACDPDGNLLWGEQGVTLSELPLYQEYVQIERQGEEYVFGWSNLECAGGWYYYYRIYAQKVVNGAIQWGTDGILVSDQEDHDCFIRDIIGPYFLFESSVDVFVSRLESDGTLSPGFETPLAVCAADGRQDHSHGEMVGDDLLVVWGDRRNDIGDYDIYGQFVHSDGSVAWIENGAPLVVAQYDQYSPLLGVHDDGFYVSWSDFSSGTCEQVRLQNFDMNATPQWDPSGLLVSLGDSHHILSAMSVNDDGALIAWRDYSSDYSGSASDLRLQLVNVEGEPLWGGGVILCDAPNHQLWPQLAPSGDDHVVIAWSDYRASRTSEAPAIYAQRVNISVTGVNDPVPAPPALHLAQNTPNPFNPETAIAFSLAAPTHITLCVYNIRGQLVNTIVNDRLPAGAHSVVWDGRDSHGVAAGSGIYLYQLRSGSHTATRRMLLLK